MPPSGGLRTSLSFRLNSAVVGRSSFDAAGLFSPGTPVPAPDPQPVRLVDFAVGENTVYTPRSSEPFGFAQLRAFANVEAVRLAIETRKDQMEALSWTIKHRNATPDQAGERDAQIRAVEAFWRRPDGVTPFASWLRLALEDLLALDAPAFERRRNRAGGLIGLDVVPGDTVKVLVDETGRRPFSPLPAYQQVIKGQVWAELTADELIYAPRNLRPNHLYGLSPVEQIIVTINMILRRQAAQLSYFTEGNIPSGILNAPDGWSADNIATFQTWFDARLSGNAAERSKAVWVPAGTSYQAFKDSPLTDQFDEWLARIVAYCFNLPPTPFVRQMNRSTAETDEARGQAEGLEPLKQWWKRVADGVIQDDLGFDDLEWGWNDGREVEPGVQSEIDDRDLRNGSATINEVRHRRGLKPVHGGDEPRVYAGSMLLPLVAPAPAEAVATGPDMSSPSDTQGRSA